MHNRNKTPRETGNRQQPAKPPAATPDVADYVRQYNKQQHLTRGKYVIAGKVIEA